jgi:hypothetical protein
VSEDIRRFLDRMAQEARRSEPGVPPRMLRRATSRRARTVLVIALAGTLIGYGGFVGVQAFERPLPPVPAAPRQCSAWNVVPSPNREPERLDNRLDAVAVLSEDDVWAVGVSYVDQEGGENFPLAMHWDGIAWTIAPVPDSFGHEGLLDVEGTSSNDVWAVGLGHDALHWDGSRWTTVPLADPGATHWHVQALSAVGPSDIWAAGNTSSEHSGTTLVEHWNGERWSVAEQESFQPEPLTGEPFASLSGIDARQGEVWAVGETQNVAAAGASNTLALHLGESVWTRPATPDVPAADGKPYSHLLSVGAVAPDDVWAVGIAASEPGYFGAGDRALIEHWDGQRWSVAKTMPVDSRLVKVLATSPNEAWAVGSNGFSGSFGPVILRWDGTSWEEVPVGITAEASLSDITQSPSGDLWAVGVSVENDHGKTLVLRCIGS